MTKEYYPYWDWEDFKNGMYDLPENEFDVIDISKCVNVFTDLQLFESIAINVFKDWEKCTRQNLTNTNLNRNAWLGRACCSYHFSIKEKTTRNAFNTITTTQKNIINNLATKLINQFVLNLKNDKQYNIIFESLD